MTGGNKKSKSDRPKKGGATKRDRKKEGADARRTRAPKRVSSDAKLAEVEHSADVVTNDGDTDVAPAESRVDILVAEPARRGPLTEMVPVRFDKQMLAAVRNVAAADHRSVSSWIRRAVDLQLRRKRSN